MLAAIEAGDIALLKGGEDKLVFAEKINQSETAITTVFGACHNHINRRRY